MTVNEQIPFTPKPRIFLSNKVKARDSKIARKIAVAWDVDHDADKVFSIFMKKKSNMSDPLYWELLRSVWVICGGKARIDEFMLLFKSKRGCRGFFSTPEEDARLKELPERFDVYRACNEDDDWGISWTLSYEYAKKYKAYLGKDNIVQQNVWKDDVFALIERNAEEEIIILR